MYRGKEQFNTEFDDLLHGKRDENAKIAERNARIAKVCAELLTAAAVSPLKYHVLESPEVCLSVCLYFVIVTP